VNVANQVHEISQCLELAMWPIRSSSRELGSEEVDANRGAVVGRTPLWDVSLVILEREIDIVPRSGLGLVLGFVCPSGFGCQSIGHGVRRVGHVQDVASDASSSCSGEMGGGDASDGFYGRFPNRG
jgi:hypothetical protein